ncbi:hypothetical protein ACLKA6_003489 [Drosophila palustris]
MLLRRNKCNSSGSIGSHNNNNNYESLEEIAQNLANERMLQQTEMSTQQMLFCLETADVPGFRSLISGPTTCPGMPLSVAQVFNRSYNSAFIIDNNKNNSHSSSDSNNSKDQPMGHVF